MITKRLTSATAAVLMAAALCLASCGDGDSGSDSGKDTPWESSASVTESGEESKADTSEADAPSSAEDSSAAAVPADTSLGESSAADISSRGGTTEDSSAADVSSQAAEPVKFDGSFTGKWELEEMTTSGVTVKGNMFGIPVAVLFQFDFKDDGTVEMMQSDYGKDIKRSTLNWKSADNGLSIIGADGSSTMDFTLEGDRLVYNREGSSCIKLVKVNEFTTYDPSVNSEADSTPADSLSEADVLGKWELEEMSSGDLTLKGDMLGVPVAIMFQFEFKSDGTGSLVRSDVDGDTDNDNIVWFVGGDILTVKFADDDFVEFSYKNGLLVSDIEEDGETLTIKIKKVDKFTTYDFPQQ